MRSTPTYSMVLVMHRMSRHSTYYTLLATGVCYTTCYYTVCIVHTTLYTRVSSSTHCAGGVSDTTLYMMVSHVPEGVTTATTGSDGHHNQGHHPDQGLHIDTTPCMTSLWVLHRTLM